MPKRCEKCPLEGGGGPCLIKFEFEGREVVFPKNAGECQDCTEERFKNIFEKYKNYLLIANVDGGVEVNWDYYVETRSVHHYYACEMNLLLQAIGVFSEKTVGVWGIVKEKEIRPCLFIEDIPQYIRDENIARQFAEIFYPGCDIRALS